MCTPNDMKFIVSIQLCSTYEILFILFCLIELDVVRLSIKQRVQQEYETFEEVLHRITIILNGTDTNNFSVVRAIDITNKITRYNLLFVCSSTLTYGDRVFTQT
jgi:hypothetical protein